MSLDTVSQTHPDAASRQPPALQFERVSIRLGDRIVLQDVDFAIAPGSFVGLIGPNGSGKSTLLRAILGVLPLAAGTILVHGKPIAESRDRFAFLPQRQQLELDVPLRAWDVVMMGRLRHTGWLRPPSRHDRDIVAWALEQVGLTSKRNSPIAEMSFGQHQRVFFARALAQEGDLILLDEPMNGVDSNTQELFLQLLAGFHAQGKTIVMATHDLNQAAAACDQLCVLNGRLIAYGPLHETLTEDVLREAYGVHLHLSPEEVAVGHLLDDGQHHHNETEGGHAPLV